jgi:hypothetical protein
MKKTFELTKTIAIVGLSDKIDRPSFKVAKYFLDLGYKIIPINPNINNWLGIKAYADIQSIPKQIKVEIVDIFRKSEEVLGIVKEVIETNRKPIIWMQEEIINEEAKKLAEKNGMEVTMGLCLMKEHQKK